MGTIMVTSKATTTIHALVRRPNTTNSTATPTKVPRAILRSKGTEVGVSISFCLNMPRFLLIYAMIL
jgi:hypothetical protein